MISYIDQYVNSFQNKGCINSTQSPYISLSLFTELSIGNDYFYVKK